MQKERKDGLPSKRVLRVKARGASPALLITRVRLLGLSIRSLNQGIRNASMR